MGVYTNGCGPAFSTSMKLFHTERKSFLPAQAHGLVVSFFGSASIDAKCSICSNSVSFMMPTRMDCHSFALVNCCVHYSHFLSRELSITYLGGHLKLLWWCGNGFLIIGFLCGQKETCSSAISYINSAWALEHIACYSYTPYELLIQYDH